MIDIVAVVLIAVAAGLGLLQGLTMILLRAGVLWLGMIALRWIQPALAQALESTAGAAADVIAMGIAVVGLLVLQQLIAWGYRKIRDALMLGIPDRLLGFTAGALVAFSLVAVVGVLGARMSESFAKNLASSHIGPLIAHCEGLVDKVVTPDRLDKGKKKLKEWVDLAK